MDEHPGRRFGARLHTSSRMRAPSSHHSSGSNSPQYPNTLEFDTVAQRSRHSTRHYNWGEDGPNDFDFSSGRHYESNNHHQQEHQRQERRPDKYVSNRLKASGQSISAPGSSIVSSEPSIVGDQVLDNVFKPPNRQTDFLTNLTKQNTNRNRGSMSTKKSLAYSTPSSLEADSAPVPKKDISRPPSGSSGWVSTRVPVRTPTKPRTLLASTEKRLKLNNEQKISTPVTSHYSLRDRTKFRVHEYSPVSTQSFSLRNMRSARLGKRKMDSEGSADKPIALDSDSEPEVQASSSKRTLDAEGGDLNGSQKNEETEAQEEKQPAVDLEDIELLATARIHNCDVMIGLFQCIVDLFFRGNGLCMRNIRAKYDSWPFKATYLIDLDDVRDARYYDVSKEAGSNEIDVEESGRMDQLLDEASFIALKLSLPLESDQAAMKSFYDPAGSDASKAYIVLRPLEDATGANLDEIIDHLRAVTDIMMINEKEQAKEHLQALVKDPFTYRPDRRSRRRNNTGGKADSSSESDMDDITGNTTVLTYPLPPCTSDIVTIISHDVSRLKPRRYLNDNIIDYYFKRLMLEHYRDNEIVQEKVLFLSSHFYSRLRAGKGATTSARMEAGYKNVSTWLTRSNFFKRSIIFIPINKDVHWSLAIILNPGLAGSASCNGDHAFSCIAVLDPLGSYHRKAAIIRNLRAFLRLEWENSQGRSSDDEAPEYGIDRVMTMNVNAPLQENSYDCGVYVLKFAEVILKNCLEIGLLSENGGVIGKDVTDDGLDALITSNAFCAEDIRATRKQIRQYIEVDVNAYQERKKEKAKA